MSTLQYGRLASVVVQGTSGNGLELAAFRCTFSIRRGDMQTPNTCDARIYNLGADTVNRIANKEFTALTIKAGYSGNFAVVFVGTIVQTRKGRENQTDTYVDITAADGDEAYNFATISQSVANANPKGVAAALFNAMQSRGVTQGYAPNFKESSGKRGRVVYGAVRDELRDFSASNEVLWSIQDGALTFIPTNWYIPSTPIPITPDTGLIGIPEQTQNGINLRCLLNPSIRIGTTIKLTSTINQFRLGVDLNSQANNALIKGQNKLNADGLYYVMTANHTGDTRGQSWYTDIFCLAADATFASADAPNALFALSGPIKPN